jgi:hypothetical protein
LYEPAFFTRGGMSISLHKANSGYLIADLTAGNKNAYHEVGLLMGLNKAKQKGHDNFLLLHNSSVGDVSKDFGFHIADFKQLRLSDTHSIGQAVKKQVAVYYGLEAC